MSTYLPFQLQDFEGYCDSLRRVGIAPGYVMYTNHHASNNKPAARLVPADHIDTVKSYIHDSSDENFRRLVVASVLFDTEWDRQTKHWAIISFEGWEVLHKAFSHLHAKVSRTLTELTGISEEDFTH